MYYYYLKMWFVRTVYLKIGEKLNPLRVFISRSLRQNHNHFIIHFRGKSTQQILSHACVCVSDGPKPQRV